MACIEFIYSQEDPIDKIHHWVKFKTNCSCSSGISIWSENYSFWSSSYHKSKKTIDNVPECLIISVTVQLEQLNCHEQFQPYARCFSCQI